MSRRAVPLLLVLAWLTADGPGLAATADRTAAPAGEPAAVEAPLPVAEDAPKGGSGPGGVVIGVAIGIGLMLLLLSNAAVMPDTSP